VWVCVFRCTTIIISSQTVDSISLHTEQSKTVKSPISISYNSKISTRIEHKIRTKHFSRSRHFPSAFVENMTTDVPIIHTLLFYNIIVHTITCIITYCIRSTLSRLYYTTGWFFCGWYDVFRAKCTQRRTRLHLFLISVQIQYIYLYTLLYTHTMCTS